MQGIYDSAQVEAVRDKSRPYMARYCFIASFGVSPYKGDPSMTNYFFAAFVYSENYLFFCTKAVVPYLEYEFKTIYVS
jgi:hypothetical protein